MIYLLDKATSPGAQLDIKAGGFWTWGVKAFFYVRVTLLNSCSNQNKSTLTIFKGQKQEKKRRYQQRVLNSQLGTFTPLIVGTNGGMGTESQLFLKNPANKLSLSKLSGSRISSVGRALDCRAGGREVDSRDRTNTEGLKMTEKWTYSMWS